MTSSKPSIAELRRVSQPPELVGRRSGEHWAGRLYMRDISPYVTRLVVPTRVTPNALTLLMIVVGLASATVATVPGLWGAVVAALGIQVYLLLDCVDGELARWRSTTSAVGAYLDRIGHYSVEAALLVAVGIRADGGIGAFGSWTTLGLLAALLHVLAKAETDLVTVARTGSDLSTEVAERPAGAGAPRPLRRLRQAIAYVPFHRLLGAVELSLALVAVAIVDHIRGDLVGTRWLVVALVAVGVIVAIGHAVMIVVSGRLR